MQGKVHAHHLTNIIIYSINSGKEMLTMTFISKNMWESPTESCNSSKEWRLSPFRVILRFRPKLYKSKGRPNNLK